MVEFKIKTDEDAINAMLQESEKWRKTIEKSLDEYLQSVKDWQIILERILEEGGVRVEIGTPEE